MKVLLKLYEAVDIFLTAKRNDGEVIEVLIVAKVIAKMFFFTLIV